MIDDRTFEVITTVTCECGLPLRCRWLKLGNLKVEPCSSCKKLNFDNGYRIGYYKGWGKTYEDEQESRTWG